MILFLSYINDGFHHNLINIIYYYVREYVKEGNAMSLYFQSIE